jgi:hypothetical protein
MSFLRCRFSRKSGVLSNTLQSINAVSTVTRSFVVTDFVDRSATDTHRFGQLPLSDSQWRHKLFNEHLTNAF